jgi:hypothetical protein
VPHSHRVICNDGSIEADDCHRVGGPASQWNVNVVLVRRRLPSLDGLRESTGVGAIGQAALIASAVSRPMRRPLALLVSTSVMR